MNRKEILDWYKKEFEKISDSIQNKDNISYSDFFKIRNFKLQNSSRENEVKYYYHKLYTKLYGNYNWRNIPFNNTPTKCNQI